MRNLQVKPNALGGSVHRGRVVGFGIREGRGSDSDFYVELRRPDGERLMFEGDAIRAALEASGVDTGYDVTIKAGPSGMPLIARTFN